MHFCTNSFARLLVAHPGVAQLAAQPTVLRRVQVLNFENSNKNANYDYLSESLADNLKTEFIKTKQFTVLNKRSQRQLKVEVTTKNLSGEQDSAPALSANCEVVVVVRFLASARRIRISADAIQALSAAMQQKLPPLELNSLRRNAALEVKL